MKIEIKEHINGEWSYRFKNKGRILCYSEGYDNKANAQRALESFLTEMYLLTESSNTKDLLKEVEYIKNYISNNP